MDLQLKNCLALVPGSTAGIGFAIARALPTKAQGKRFAEFETEFFEKVPPTSPIKRFATPEEVAAMVAYVAIPLASATTGAALRVDGGRRRARSGSGEGAESVPSLR